MPEPATPDSATPEFRDRRTARHPVRIVHLGLGAFHRAHQAWYTQRANELAGVDAGADAAAGANGAMWGIESFTGRSARAAEALSAQDCIYTLIERGPDGDSATLIESISAASSGSDVARWRTALSDPDVAIVTLTVTENGYHSPGGVLNWADEQVHADLTLLRDDVAVAPVTAPARIVDGLRARWRGAGSPIAIVSCDNLSDNGRVLHDAVTSIAAQVDSSLVTWIESTVSFVSTMVDRITPATTRADFETALALTGLPDEVPVVTEPFSEWVLAGEFPAGRPNWEAAGARFVDDVTPYERRKLWLLNGGHSLLAYRGLLRGHATIAEAMADRECVDALEELWVEARQILTLPNDEIDDALRALRSRFSNTRIEHKLTQIARDGSAKLPQRTIDVMRRRLAAGLPAGPAGIGVIAAWALHLASPERIDPGSDALAADVAGLSSTETAAAVLAALAPDLGDTPGLVAELSDHIEAFTSNMETGAR